MRCGEDSDKEGSWASSLNDPDHRLKTSRVKGGTHPQFTFTEAVSFIVHCETQEELDRKWEQLSEGGAVGQCGWLKDHYGLSWQIVPAVLPTMLSDPNAARAGRVLQAVMRMQKLDINALEEAFGPRS